MVLATHPCAAETSDLIRGSLDKYKSGTTIMEAEILIENRKLNRFIVNVKVYDMDTGDVMGYSANMHTRGMMLSTSTELPVDKEYNIKLEYMQLDEEMVEIPLRVRTIWCNAGNNPDFCYTGLLIIDSTPEQRSAIEELIEELAV